MRDGWSLISAGVMSFTLLILQAVVTLNTNSGRKNIRLLCAESIELLLSGPAWDGLFRGFWRLHERRNCLEKTNKTGLSHANNRVCATDFPSRVPA